MYSSNFSGGRSFGRDSRGGGSSRGSGSNNRGGSGSYGNRGGGRGRGLRNVGDSIHFSRFISQPEPQDKIVKFVPTHAFTDFAIDEKLKANILAKGYSNPSPIQDKIIPHVLNGSDVVGIANTGTGKTGAFLIPLTQKVITDKNSKVLIVAPTRELAQQIDQELKSFTVGMQIFSVCAVGGAALGPQIRELRYHNNFIIGTPGRLKFFIEEGFINLREFGTVVLDEADRMLDMGFINDMKFMMSKMPTNRHTLFFSATLSKEIENLIGAFLREPIHVSVKTRDTAKNVHQDIVRVEKGGSKGKIDVLHDLLLKEEFNKVIIFGRTKYGVEDLSNELTKRGFKASSIHGDKNQAQRQRALSLFKQNQIKILVATDVAARGLDIPDVSHVINYDIPSTYEDYVHRIGRTGRGDKMGKALTFVS